MARVALPVADSAEVRRYAKFLMRKHYGRLVEVVGLHGLAALAGLGAPLLFGRLIDELRSGTTLATVDKLVLGLLAFALTRAVLTRFAALASTKLGELVLAELREDFVDRVLAIPLSTVERAGTGDLVTRTSRDVAALSHTVRRGVPETLIAIVAILVTGGALVWLSPLLALPCLVGVPFLIAGTRWYLRRAVKAYLRENASSSELIDGLTEAVEGARTTEALRRRRAPPGAHRQRPSRELPRRAGDAAPAIGLLADRRHGLHDSDRVDPVLRRLVLHAGLGHPGRRSSRRCCWSSSSSIRWTGC